MCESSKLSGCVLDMLTALTNVRALVVEGAMTGFNCHDGDWAERLFASQHYTSRAIEKAADYLRAEDELRREASRDDMRGVSS